MQDNAVAAVIEQLANMVYLGAIYQQIWVIRPYCDNGIDTLAIVDERSGEEKFVLHNPDGRMKEAMSEIYDLGWIGAKKKYLTNRTFRAEIIEN